MDVKETLAIGVRNQIEELLRNDGEPDAYIKCYYSIPAHNKDWRSQFYRKIFKQASKKSWSREKLATVLSGIY